MGHVAGSHPITSATTLRIPRRADRIVIIRPDHMAVVREILNYCWRRTVLSSDSRRLATCRGDSIRFDGREVK